MTSRLASEAGAPLDKITIDGTDYDYPGRLTYNRVKREAVSQTFNGRRRFEYPNDGDYLPDVPDVFDFTLDFELATEQAAIVSLLETLRAQAGTHAFVVWKQFRFIFTAISGQAFYYLPRPDAFGKSYSGKGADAYKAIVTVNGVTISAANTEYDVASVTSAQVVTAGHVKISNTGQIHPDSGALVAPFKLGTTPTAGQVIVVDYHPLFYVEAIIDTKAWEPGRVVREDKTLTLVESN